MPTKKKSRKIDPKLIASKQKSEISYIATRFKIKSSVVRDACKVAGRSRAAVYQYLRGLGYKIPTRKYKN